MLYNITKFWALTPVIVWGYSHRNEIGAKGTGALAEAISSAGGPERQTLNLYSNKIGVEGAKALAEAVVSGGCPQVQTAITHLLTIHNFKWTQDKRNLAPVDKLISNPNA